MDSVSCTPPYYLTSYRTPSTVISDAVYQVIRGCAYGAVWGMVTPFHAPGSAGAIEEAKTGIFKAARPFSSFRSIGHNAAIFGTVMGVQRLSSKSLELIRQREDFINEIFGFGITYKYYGTFLSFSEQRLMLHNRIFGGMILAAIVYGQVV